MNIAYFIYVGKYIENDMFDVCIRSLKKHSDCKIVVYTSQLENKTLLESRGVDVIEFPISNWNDRRMTCKVEKAYQLIEDLNLQDGDNILTLDADLIFVKNPFDVFENNFDFMYTTRHYSSEFKPNGGVWGYTVNDSSKNFMKFYIDQVNNPTWNPYVKFRKSHPHNRDINNKDWWVDQDFLCVCDRFKNEINEGSLGFDVKLYDAKSKYNYIITNGYKEAVSEIEKEENYVLHLKGGTFNRWGSSDTDNKKDNEQTAYDTYFRDWLES